MRRLGGPKVRKARKNFADPLEGSDVFMYLDASIALLLDLRRRIEAVLDLLLAMIRDGITLARSLELTARWGGLGEWCQVMEGLHRRFSDFIHRVVVHRKEEAFRG